MMGQKSPTSKLFYLFCLDEQVPAEHLLRRVATTVDFSFVRRLTRRFYSHTGQPSVDPVVLFKMVLVGYLYGITSERRLAEEVRLNLAYRWFIGYDLDERPPDHSVLSKARQRFGSTVYQGFFTEIVRQCERAGLVRGDKLYVDSTLVAADASLESVGSRTLVTQLPDINAHVARLWDDNAEVPEPEESSAVAPRRLRPAEETAQTIQPAGPGVLSAEQMPASLPPAAPDAAQTSAARGPHLATVQDPPNGPAGRVNGWVVSRTDPEAELVSRSGVPLDLYYKVHVGVDAGQARIITAVEVTGGAVADEHLLERVIREHEGTVGRRVSEVVADAKYGTADNYAALERRGIAASIPPHTNGATTRAIPAEQFTYDASGDLFLCPTGHQVRRQGISATAGAHGGTIYRARPQDCAACGQKLPCCGTARARTIFRPADGGLRDRVDRHLRTFRARQSIRQRPAWVETVFGDGKEHRGLGRAQFRGRDRMRIQALLTATAQNVRKLALRKAQGPSTGAGALEKGTQTEPVLSMRAHRHLWTVSNDRTVCP
jgi:transposase